MLKIFISLGFVSFVLNQTCFAAKDPCQEALFNVFKNVNKASYSEDPIQYVQNFKYRIDPLGETKYFQKQSSLYGDFFGLKEVEMVWATLKQWGLTSELTTEQKNILAPYLLERAHGLKTGRNAELQANLESQGIVFKNKSGENVTVDALDLAISKANESNLNIRVYPTFLSKFADNNTIPQPVINIKGERGRDAQSVSSQTEFATRAKRVEEIRKAGTGTLLIGDLHLLRGEAENKAYERLLEQLKDTPPKKIILGGDVVDGVGFQRKAATKLAKDFATEKVLPTEIQSELNRLAELLAGKKELPAIIREPSVQLEPGSNPPRFTPQSEAKLRFAMIVLQLKRMKETLPNTEIEFIVGNHDVPRQEFLSRPKDKETVTVVSSEKKSVTLKLPFILSLDRGELKKEALLSTLANYNPELSKEQLTAATAKAFPKLKEIFAIKGSSLDTLSEHRHYDLAFADWFTQRLRDFNVNTLITDPAVPVQVGSTLLSHEPLFQTREFEKAPNISRIIAPADNPRGNMPRVGDFASQSVNFDQHTSASITNVQPNGRKFDTHLIGAFSALNTNPGQRFTGGLLDPQTGELHHITFFDADKLFSDPDSLGIQNFRLATETRLNFLSPESDKQGTRKN